MKSFFKSGASTWAVIFLMVTISICMIGFTGCKSSEPVKKESLSNTEKINNAAESKSKNEFNGVEKYVNLVGISKEKLEVTLNEKPISIDEGGLEFKKEGMRVWFKDYGDGQVVSQLFTQRNDIDFNGARIGDKISSFRKALGNPVSDNNGDVHFKYKGIFLSFNYDTKTENTFCAYFLKEDFNADEANQSIKPQIEVPVDLEVEKNEQKSVDAEHSPWRLDPAFVAQVFVSLKISPQGINGEYPIKTEDLKIIKNTGKEAVVQVSGEKTPISKVYLKRLVKQDSTGIWTVVGYDPLERK